MSAQTLHPQYAVLGTYQDHHHGTCFEIAWTGHCVEVICVGTRELPHPWSDNTPATPEEDLLARAWTVGPLARDLIDRAAVRSREPHPGRVVQSTTTRGKNKGVTGTVKRVEVNYHNHTRTAFLLTVELDGGQRRTLRGDQVQVIAGFGRVPTANLAAHAADMAFTMSWKTLTRHMGLRD